MVVPFVGFEVVVLVDVGWVDDVVELCVVHVEFEPVECLEPVAVCCVVVPVDRVRVALVVHVPVELQ